MMRKAALVPWWQIALVVAAVLVVFASALSFVRLPADRGEGTAPKNSPPAVVLTPLSPEAGEQALQEQATLLDPTPLFLPTPYNTSQPRVAADNRREPGALFPLFPPQLAFNETSPEVAFPANVAIPVRPVDGLHVGEPQDPFFGIGSRDLPAATFQPRWGFIEVCDAASGRVVLSLPLTRGAELAVPSPADWHPMELLATVDVHGLVGEPVMNAGSGSEEMDSFIQGFLAKDFHLGERLRPGFYRLRVGP